MLVVATTTAFQPSERREKSLTGLKMSDQASVLTQALGSVLGYAGGEVAEVATFERLLWPQRFYNDTALPTMLKQALLMTMGGPLHSAALKTLDVYRKHGLYRGPGRGNFLGTAFYPDLRVHYQSQLSPGEPGYDADNEVRNGFWVEVLRELDRGAKHGRETSPKPDAEAANGGRFRALQAVHHLHLRSVAAQEKPTSRTKVVAEDRITWKTLLGVLLSETVAVAVALVALLLGTWWMALFLLVPLLLKLCSLVVHVRREGLQPAPVATKRSASNDTSGEAAAVDIFELAGLQQGFLLIEGPVEVVKQFFRHYGHPLRGGRAGLLGDRWREMLCIAMTYAFVLYFPAGLILSIWMDEDMQYLWLAYELYAVLAMHLLRLLDWQGSGRTEHVAARHLNRQGVVWLVSSGGAAVQASVRTDLVHRYSEGAGLVRERVLQRMQASTPPGLPPAAN